MPAAVPPHRRRGPAPDTVGLGLAGLLVAALLVLSGAAALRSQVFGFDGWSDAPRRAPVAEAPATLVAPRHEPARPVRGEARRTADRVVRTAVGSGARRAVGSSSSPVVRVVAVRRGDRVAVRSLGVSRAGARESAARPASAGFDLGAAAELAVGPPTASDDDGDGLADAVEAKLGTALRAVDTDGDTLPDGWEAANGLDPLNAADAGEDLDLDGLTNRTEFAVKASPVRADSNADGVPDGDDDADGDGLTNAEEQAQSSDPADASSTTPDSAPGGPTTPADPAPADPAPADPAPADPAPADPASVGSASADPVPAEPSAAGPPPLTSPPASPVDPAAPAGPAGGSAGAAPAPAP